MGAVQVTTLFDSDEAENEYMKAGSGLMRVAGTEAGGGEKRCRD